MVIGENSDLALFLFFNCKARHLGILRTLHQLNMSPRGGGGGSSGSGGRSGGGSVSSSSGSKGGNLFGSGGTRGTSSYSGGSKGGSSSRRPSYSGSSKGGKGPKSPSYLGGTKGGRGSKRPLGGNGRHSCDDDDSDDDDACPYTSAAIPSKNNPFSFLSRRTHVQPRDQSQNVFEDIKEPFAAFENHLLFESQSAGSQNSMNAAHVTPEYDSRSICQAPHGNKCKVLLCGVASDPVPFFLGLVLLFLLGAILSTSSKGREHHKRPRKAKEDAKRTYESHTGGIKVMHIEFADSSKAGDTKAANLADVETATSNVEMEEPVEGCEKPCKFVVW